ncbi:MAG: dienelactone hydrolase family protein [Verrucomicrobia bacterium]|nr:dienelactone hydrolase family protein [Verrucomicrobiota bacterium]
MAADSPEGGEVISGKLPHALEGRYLLFVPAQAKAGQKLPMIVALHGAGGKPEGSLRWWQAIAAERGYFVLAPKSNGGTWPGADQSHVGRIVTAMERERPIDPKRVLLTGVSDGGAWTYVLGFQNPNLYAGIAPISAILPRAVAGALRMQPKLPIHVVHGADDRIFIVARAREAVRALQAERYAVTYVEVSGGKHGFFRDKAGEILDWFEKLQKH